MKPTAPIDRELLRKAVLKYLVHYHPGAFTADSIASILPQRSFIDFTPDAELMASTLDILKGLGLVESVESAFGCNVYWKATSKGVIEVEREDVEP